MGKIVQQIKAQMVNAKSKPYPKGHNNKSRGCGMNVVNFIINPKLLETKTKERVVLLNPLDYYLSNVGI